MFVWCLCGHKIDDHEAPGQKQPCKACDCPYLTFRAKRDLYEDAKTSQKSENGK